MRRAGLAVLSLAAIVALVAVQQLTTVGGSSLLGQAVTNALHIPLFAVLTLLLMPVLGYPSWRVLLVSCVAAAAATEALQMLTGRNASLMDFGLDLLGALPVIGAVEIQRRGRGRGRAFSRRLWSCTALVILVMTVAGPARVLLAYHERDRVFPVLFIPGGWELGPLVSSNSQARLVAGPEDWENHAGEPVLEVVWSDRRYPGITLSEVVPAWENFSALAVDVYLPQGPPMVLTAAVGHHGREGTAAFVRHRVEPGPRRLIYDLGALLATGEGAPPAVSKLILHTNRDHAGRRLLIGRVRLLRAGEHQAFIEVH